MLEREKLRKELGELQSLKERIQKSRILLPEGKLHCSMSHGKYPQYYLLFEEEKDEYPHGRYVKKTEIALAREYAQEEYDGMMVEEIDRKEKEIRRYLKLSKSGNLSDVFDNLPEAKKRLIVPYVLPNSEYVKQWKESLNGGWNSFPISNGFITEQGELVRSKSEKMIADKLYVKGIPYVYEARLILNNNRMAFPDFAMLNIKERETYFLEHFGMMDDPEYCKNALEKIDMYEDSHIYLGDKLLVTFESSRKPINVSQIDSIIERLLR